VVVLVLLGTTWLGGVVKTEACVGAPVFEGMGDAVVFAGVGDAVVEGLGAAVVGGLGDVVVVTLVLFVGSSPSGARVGNAVALLTPVVTTITVVVTALDIVGVFVGVGGGGAVVAMDPISRLAACVAVGSSMKGVVSTAPAPDTTTCVSVTKNTNSFATPPTPAALRRPPCVANIAMERDSLSVPTNNQPCVSPSVCEDYLEIPGGAAFSCRWQALPRAHSPPPRLLWRGASTLCECEERVSLLMRSSRGVYKGVGRSRARGELTGGSRVLVLW
jgi:hypothetical protein